MILSVSRRTDVPSFYYDWFINRLRQGWLLVRNPFNPSQVSRVPLTPAVIECVVFWTKNPSPMLGRLDELRPFTWYIQYTINAYGPELEGHVPELSRRLDVFRALADQVGKERVVWRYSPVVCNAIYTDAYHCDVFGRLAEALSGYTDECKVSFLELYPKIASRMNALGVVERGDDPTLSLARQLFTIAALNGIAVSACGKPDLRPAGIAVSSCVDPGLIQRITGERMSFKKDPGQRGMCQCVESIDVGTYQTCLNGCSYCYATHSHRAAVRKAACYDPESPLLCDALRPGDVITVRKFKMHATGQGRLPFRKK